MRVPAYIVANKSPHALPHNTLPRPPQGEPLSETHIVAAGLWKTVQAPSKHHQELPVPCARPEIASDPIMHPSSLAPCLDQPSRTQPSQVARHLVLRHAERVHQFADAQLLAAQEANQPQAGGVRQNRQELGHIFHDRRVSRYMPIGAYIIPGQSPRQLIRCIGTAIWTGGSGTQILGGPARRGRHRPPVPSGRSRKRGLRWPTGFARSTLSLPRA